VGGASGTRVIVEKMCKVLVEKPKGRRPFGRPRRRCEDVVCMYLRVFGCGIEDWIHLAQDWDRWRAPVNAVLNLRVLSTRS
jgi:hypothetical protein